MTFPFPFFWPIGFSLPVLLIVGFVFLMIRMLRGPRGDRAIGILRERYAKGELSKEEFERMRRDLGG